MMFTLVSYSIRAPSSTAMDSLLQLQVIIAGIMAMAFTCISWAVKTTARTRNKYKEAPQPPGALPLIGHLHLLIRNRESPSRALAAMADRHGPIFMLRLGRRRVLVVSGCAAARECLAANDRALASRPRTAVARHMGYDHAMLGFAPYGPYWRSVRKLATAELLSNARVAAFEHVRSTEISARMAELYELWEKKGRTPVVVDLKRVFKDLAFSVAARVVAGKRWCLGGLSEGDADEVRRLRWAMDELSRLLFVFVVSDYLPFLGWMDVGGYEKAMKSAAGDMDAVVGRWLEEHCRRGSAGVPEGEGDFMDVLLSAMDGPEFSELDANKVIKATCLAMILGGNDTTVISLIRNAAVLMDNPQVLRKAREELDLHVGRRRNVEEADVKNLAYLHAIVKETFRLHPTAELLLPHEATEDCHISGFHVPAGTRVLTNVWKLQRDPAVWPDPTEYVPERFLGSHAHVDVKGRHFELIPFGAGRRICPGISFALHVMHLTLARLIHGFELGMLPSAALSYVDLESILSPTPFEVVLAPRLPLELYR